MKEELQQAIQSGIITEKQARKLEALVPGAYCQHKSWGVGKVAEWRLITGQLAIDFQGKPGHLMQVSYAAESLTPIPPDHIRARIFENPDQVREEAENHPEEIFRKILLDLGGRATVSQLLAEISPKLFPDAAKAKRLWDKAKAVLRKDGHFHLPVKKTDFVEYREESVATHVNLLEKFRRARHMKDQVLAADALTKSLEDFKHEVEELQKLAMQIEEAASKGHRLQPAQALELLLARDAILKSHETLKCSETALQASDILRQAGGGEALAELFLQLPAAKQRDALLALEAAFGPDEWADKAFFLMQKAGARIVSDVVKLFEAKGLSAQLKERLASAIAGRSASSDVLYWLCKERGGSFKDLFGPTLFGAVLSAIELDHLSEQKKSTRLRDLITNDTKLLEDFFEKADISAVRDAMRRLMLTTVFNDLDKRSLLGRLIKRYPELQSMVSGDAGQEDESLTVSWASLERRKAEYDDLVNRLIPQNVRDIQTARSYGDLRENFEFKSAKEQQAVLARRKTELERALAKARGTNFENPDTSVVSIGTTVRILNLSTQKEEIYSILGAWDSAPEFGIISYKAAIGQSLLGRKPGEEVEIPGGATARILSIEAFTNLPLLEKIAAGATQS